MARKGQTAVATIRRNKAVSLAADGVSYRQIGERLEIGHSQAYKDVQRALGELDGLTGKQAERVRDLELVRLNKLTLALQAKSQSSNISVGELARVTDSLLRIMERRAKLLGLDMPAQGDAQGDGGVQEGARAALTGILVTLAQRVLGLGQVASCTESLPSVTVEPVPVAVERVSEAGESLEKPSKRGT